MSRIGKAPIQIPDGVEVKIEGQVVTAKGPLGTETVEVRPEVALKLEGKELIVSIHNDDRKSRSLWGLSRTLLNNAIQGVKTGFEKKLEIQGVGYRAAKQGKNLVMNLGFSHQVIVPEVDGITIEVPNPNSIVISGADRQQVGQFAAEVRNKRPPEPYKGKGIRYAGEYVRRKEGKAGKGA